MVGDPIGDFINRIKNASKVGIPVVVVPYSRIKEAIANLLKKEGYVGFVNVKGKGVKKALEVGLIKTKEGFQRISDVKRVSTPGRRVYRGFKEIRPVKFGKGSLVLSTPDGIISDKEARKTKVGGEVLFKIW